MRLYLKMLYIVRCYIYNIGNNPVMENYLQIQVGMRIKDLRDREGVSQENFALCLLRACPMMIPRVADTHSTRCR